MQEHMQHSRLVQFPLSYVRSIICALVIVMLSTSLAFACSCSETNKLSEMVEKTSIIFEGEVLKVTKPIFRPHTANIKFKVTRVHKDKSVKKIEYVTVPDAGGGSCSLRFREGNKALIFAHKTEGNRGLSSSSCSKGHYFKDADYLDYLNNGVDKTNKALSGRIMTSKYSNLLFPWETWNNMSACRKETRSMSSLTHEFKAKRPVDYKAAKNLSNAQLWYLSRGYLKNSHREPTLHKAAGLTYLKLAADRGHTAAQNQLGDYLSRCFHGLTLDVGDAREYLNRAAVRDNTSALYNLVILLSRGIEGHHDTDLAQRYLQKCISLDSNQCIFIAKTFEARKGIDQNSDTEFAKYYREYVVPKLITQDKIVTYQRTLSR